MFHLIFRVNKDWHSSKQFLSDSLFRTIDSFFLSVSGVWLKTQSPVVRLKFVESCRNCKQVKKAVENGLVEVVVVWARSQPPFWPLQKQWTSPTDPLKPGSMKTWDGYFPKVLLVQHHGQYWYVNSFDIAAINLWSSYMKFRGYNPLK